MKLSNIAPPRPLLSGKKNRLTEATGISQMTVDRMEIDRLATANSSNSLLLSQHLDELEIDLAQQVLLKISSQPTYIPSQLVMQFVRGLNAKI